VVLSKDTTWQLRHFTLPCATCESDHTFSALHCMKNYLWSKHPFHYDRWT